MALACSSAPSEPARRIVRAPGGAAGKATGPVTATLEVAGDRLDGERMRVTARARTTIAADMLRIAVAADGAVTLEGEREASFGFVGPNETRAHSVQVRVAERGAGTVRVDVEAGEAGHVAELAVIATGQGVFVGDNGKESVAIGALRVLRDRGVLSAAEYQRREDLVVRGGPKEFEQAIEGL